MTPAPARALPSTSAGPPQPVYILRGHSSQIHALHFTPGNTHLLTGDASGFVVLWSLSSRRPVAVWRAHVSPILRISTWPGSSRLPRIITHGRDHALHCWRILESHEYSTTLPLDPSSENIYRPMPWLAASLSVNTLNFCRFSSTPDPADVERLWLAVPGAADSEAVDIMRLPDGARVSRSIKSAGMKTGMAMAVALCPDVLAAGYESGDVVVFRRQDDGSWDSVYSAKVHTQPILGITMWAEEWAVSCSADSLLVKYEWPEGKHKSVDTRHLGQQGVVVRGDGKIVATAGWDGRLRVYNATGGMKELAVLKWHTVGCYAVAFGDMTEESGRVERALTVAEERTRREARRHWVAGGDKAGKVSLWNIY